MKIRLFVCTLAVALVQPCVVADDGEIPWTSNLGRALKQARESDKPAIVDVWATWCEPCKELDTVTFRDPGVVELAAEFIPVKLNADVHESFYDVREIQGLPVILFLDSSGKELSRKMGLLSAERLIELMTKVRDGYRPYLESRERLDDPEAMRFAGSYLVEIGNADGAARLLRRSLKALKRADPSEREQVELLWANADCVAEGPSPGCNTLERLSRDATAKRVRGEALQNLVSVERNRGRSANAERHLERLRQEFPEMASDPSLPTNTP